MFCSFKYNFCNYFCGKVFGGSNTGKTQLCLSAVAICASSGGKVNRFILYIVVFPFQNFKTFD